MANVDDYTSGRIQQQAALVLAFLKSAEDSLAGSKQGKQIEAGIRAFQPRLIDMAEAERRIQAAHRCAVGPRACYPNTPKVEFTETVFLDELAEGMAAAGKAELVNKEKAVDTLAKYKKNPLVLMMAPATVTILQMPAARATAGGVICKQCQTCSHISARQPPDRPRIPATAANR
jgi:hypothetical protein